jgi:hypothetical protein
MTMKTILRKKFIKLSKLSYPHQKRNDLYYIVLVELMSKKNNYCYL